MIRANLLPRPKDDVRLFGFAVDAEYVRAALAGAAVVLLVAAVGFGIVRARIARLTALVANADAAIAERAPQRLEAKGLALDVARYQAFSRETTAFRRSGSDAAIVVARIGNSVPRAVWLDELERGPDGYTVAGGARSVDAIGETMLALATSLPAARAELVSLDARSGEAHAIRFSAHVGATAGAEP